MALDARGEFAKTVAQKIVKQFIDAYKTSPELWDPMDVNYGNQGKRMLAQERLLEIMKKIQPDATRHDVRAKINSIRSNYKKLKSKVEEAKAEGRRYTPKNWSFKHLRFLDSIKKPDSPKLSPDSELGDTDNEIDHYKDDASYVVMDDASAHEDVDDIKYESTPPKKHKVDRVESTTPRKNLRFPGILKVDRPSTSAIEPIALVWSSKLQTLRLNQRLLAEKAINDVLFEASLNNLGKGALIINTGSSISTEPKEEYLECSSSEDEWKVGTSFKNDD